MTKEEIELKKNMEQQRKINESHIKLSARSTALIQSPTRKIDKSTGIEMLLTASERMKEAEIIYQWLIKQYIQDTH